MKITYTARKVNLITIYICAIRHKGVYKAVGCRTAEAIGLIYKNNVCPVSCGGKGSGSTRKASADNCNIVFFHNATPFLY